MSESPRDALAGAFLATTDWAGARRAPLAGDASKPQVPAAVARS